MTLETEAPGTETPGTETPGTETPGTETPGTRASWNDFAHETDRPSRILWTRYDLAYWAGVAVVFADIAEGLAHAHCEGVVHRDIKPSNLIVDATGRLRIFDFDFGLAYLEELGSLTLTGDVVGTPLYMSPEQARRESIPVDHRTDVWSLGATLYELLTLRPPFRGKDRHDTLRRIIERDPPRLRAEDPRLPDDLETVVLKCLSKEPEARYRTAQALAQDLRRFADGDSIEARPESRGKRLRRNLWRWRVPLAVGLVNDDDAVDISDGIAVLEWLFNGGAEPGCLDAADIDDNGQVELTDAVRLFGYLFNGGPAPSDPAPTAGVPCGADPTADTLGFEVAPCA